MELIGNEPKEPKVRRTTAVGPNFGTVKLMDHKPIDSGVNVLTRSVSAKLQGSSRILLPLSFMSAPSGSESAVPQFDLTLDTVNSITLKREILCCHYTENFKHAVAGTIDGVIRIYKSGKVKEQLFTFKDDEIFINKSSVTSINCRPVNNGHPETNSILCTYINGHIKCWNYKYNQCLYTIIEKGPIYGLTYHMREPKFIIHGIDDHKETRFLLYDEETRVLERVFNTNISRQRRSDMRDTRIFASCFHPRSNHIVLTAGANDVVTFWDARTPTSFREIIGPHVVRNGLEIHRKRNEILTCSWRKENQIQLWDFDSGKLISVLSPDEYQSQLYCGKYFARNLLATGGAHPNLLRIINLQTSKTIAKIKNLPGAVYNLDIGWSKENRQKEIKPRILFCSGKNLFEADIMDYELSL